MQLQLLKGVFTKEDAAELLRMLVDVKIKFHESKIEQGSDETDIKMREKRIRQLQNEYTLVRDSILKGAAHWDLHSEIIFSDLNNNQ